jgi:GT2 family glycosyltransferase
MLLMDAELFRSIGGFDEVYVEEAQDIDLCLRLRKRGLQSVMHPALQAYHHENATRTVKEAPQDRAEFLRRFGRLIEEDLYAWQATIGLGEKA